MQNKVPRVYPQHERDLSPNQSDNKRSLINAYNGVRARRKKLQESEVDIHSTTVTTVQVSQFWGFPKRPLPAKNDRSTDTLIKFSVIKNSLLCHSLKQGSFNLAC